MYMLNIHSTLVGERMSDGSEAMSEHSSSIHLVTSNDKVYRSGYESIVEDSTSSQEKELSAHFSEEEEEEEEETTSSSGLNKSPRVA